MKKYLFFDNASTTKCCEAAVQLIQRFASEDFGNPSSAHAFGQQAARAIREARVFFGRTFQVDPEQVIFTGSGSESDNLAIYGIATQALVGRKARQPGPADQAPPRVICSAIEHPAVRKTAQSLSALGVDVQLAPVDSRAQLDRAKLAALLTPATVLVSVHAVNNIVGSVLPVEELAREVKARAPGAIFHSDCVQAFGRVKVPTGASSPVDLVSISGHKIEGPKGVGALIVLNKKLLQGGLRPLIWGGEQEGGFRSGTQNAGLIAGFHAAAARTLDHQPAHTEQMRRLRSALQTELRARKLLTDDPAKSVIRWNSPPDAVPHIVNLSVAGFPSGPLAKLLEERQCLVSTGSACSSQKMEPDPVLSAMGLPASVHSSAIRVSFGSANELADVETLAQAFDESIALMSKLLGGKSAR